MEHVERIVCELKVHITWGWIRFALVAQST